jgi:hypothetical protein
MMRATTFLGVLGLLVGALAAIAPWCWAAEEIVDPQAAKADPDFLIQGEYLGNWLGGAKSALGAQVVALGDGKFDVYLLKGGLPGAGWKRGDSRIQISGSRGKGIRVLGADKAGDKAVALTGDDTGGKIVDGVMTLSMGKGRAELKRVERKSPTLEAKPPQGAVVLFDGTGTAAFEGGVLTKDRNLMGGTTTKKKFEDYTLHVEFRLSYMPHARGQGRSNSGVYIHDCYEVQVLDSFGLTGENNECGGLYSIKAPDVNMCLPPLVWQTFDIDLTAPRYDASGVKVKNARLTVRHNGVLIHENLDVPKGTPGRAPEGPGPRPIHLQAHGNKVEYRNIWLVEKK